MPCGYYIEEAEEGADGVRARRAPRDPVGAHGMSRVDATSYFSRPGPRIGTGWDPRLGLIR